MVDPVSERTRIRRLPDKAVADRRAFDAIADAGLVAHVGIVDDDAPVVVPMGYARRGDQLIVHGSSGSRLMRLLADGAQCCVTITLLDGLVYARSAFESSMNYRSAMLFGRAIRLTDDDELDALRVLSEHLLPGRWMDARPPNRKERAATITVALPIEEWSVKVSQGDPEDDPSDLTTEPWKSIWAGHVPLAQMRLPAVTDPHVPAGVPVPDYVQDHA